MWLARDKDGSLCLYAVEPIQESNAFYPIHPEEVVMEIQTENEFTDKITWDNSPVEISKEIGCDLIAMQ